ncbi:MAG: periplasmic heavy metal sensor [Bryobacteraceae bacterium]|jgi:Spy/CpxP family protein refolding chaperone
MLVRLLLIGLLAAGFASAQISDPGEVPSGGGGGGMGGGGGRGGGGGMGGAGMGGGIPRMRTSMLDRMATACDLTKDQKKQFKTILDADSKDAEALRKEIPANRSQVEAAVLAGKSADDIKKLLDEGGMLDARMVALELKAFGQLCNVLEPDQRKQGGQRVLSMLYGIFMVKSWDSL